MVATNLERYEILKRHLPDEAARVIAEAWLPAEQLVTRDYLDARLTEQSAQIHEVMRRLEARIDGRIDSLQRWMLAFMASLWLGMGGMIVTILVKG